MDKKLEKLNKIIFVILFFSFSLMANEKVKATSELELFLFKIGFESLLKDVNINKKDTSYNKEQVELINQKVNLIMEEIYKNNLNLNSEEKTSSKSELNELKEQVQEMSKQINFLQKKINLYDKLEKDIDKKPVTKKPVVINKDFIKEKPIKYKKVNNNYLKAVVNKDGMFVKDKPTFEGSKTIDNYVLGKKITLESCNKYGWCKLLNEDKYVVEYLLRFY